MCVLLHVFWGPEVKKVAGAGGLAPFFHLGTPKNVGQNTHLPLPLLKVASLAWARGPGRGKKILSSLLAAWPGENEILSSLLATGPRENKILSSLLAASRAKRKSCLASWRPGRAKIKSCPAPCLQAPRKRNPV